MEPGTSDEELRPFTEAIQLESTATPENALPERGARERSNLLKHITNIFRSSSRQDDYPTDPERPPPSGSEEEVVSTVIVPESFRKPRGSQTHLDHLPLPEEPTDEYTITHPDQGVLLTLAQEKYSRAKKANYSVCGLSAILLVCILGFVCITYISMLPGGALTGEQQINPYIADGKLTNSYMNRKLDPCEDFLNYSMQHWFESVELPEGRGRFSYTFDAAKANVTHLLREILNQDWPYLSPFYRSCQARPKALASRVYPISNWALRISAQTNRSSVFRYMAKLRAETGIDLKLLFGLSIVIDPSRPTQHAYSLSANGFLLPSKPHYSNPATLAFYQNWVREVFSFIGFTISPQRVANLVESERQAAQLGLSVDELYDPLETTNYYTYPELAGLLGPSAFAYLQELAPLLNASALFIVDDVRYFQNLTLPTLEVLRDTALLRLLKLTLPLLDTAGESLVSNYSQYFGRAPSQEYCQDLTDGYLGWLIAQYYAKEVYEPADKTRVAQIWSLLREKLKLLVGDWSWLDEDSREQALAKYESIEVLAAYPDEWPSYDDWFSEAGVAPLRSDSVLDNVVKLLRVSDFQLLKRINQPVDRHDWLMTPTAVNAYYEPSTNVIVLPLAIEQEPFLSSGQPYAGNLAMFWAVVMHEAFHAIDSTGALYDSTGRLTEWMSSYSRNVFNTRVQCIEEQFSEYTVVSSLNHLNGKLVSGEAMADLNGLKLCYSLLQELVLTRNATWDQESKWIDDAYDGLTMEQLFFVKYAQLWAQEISPSYALELSRTDPHPLAEDRVLGTLSNMESFATAFDCPVGSKYNPRMKCSMD